MHEEMKNRRGEMWACRLGIAVIVLVLVAMVLSVGLAGGMVVERQLQAAAPAPSAMPAPAESQPSLPALPAATSSGAASPAASAPAPAATSTPAPAAAATPSAADLKLLTEAWNTIQQDYVAHSDVSSTELIYGAISGMVQALNDTGHSRFLTPEMVKAENDYTSGSYDGIGAEVANKNGQTVIVAPLDGSPAQKAGLKAGDVILKVDGEDVSQLPLEQVVSKILGPAGTQVTITLYTPSTNKTTDYQLTRAHLTLQNVTWQFIPGTKIAHVRVSAFSQGVSRALQTALTDIQKQGATGIVLDLRDNPGGLLDEAINTASQFVGSGDVLLTRDAQGKVTHIAARRGGKALNTPMVVLVNQGSASASEIVAAAIQDAGRAKLVGETTFGTGTVLNQFPLSDGSALLLATQEWLTPKGRVIWHKGVAPDVTVKLDAGAAGIRPNDEKTMTAEQLQSSGDAQLLKALSLLTTSVVAK